MVDIGFISASIVVSNILGGVITLLIAVGVSTAESKRRAKNRKQNWYRTVHNTLVRAYGTRNVNHRGLDNTKLREYAQLYRAFAEQIENQLADAPTREVDLPLFNALQNIQLSFIKYANETETLSPDKLSLHRRHENAVDFCLISMYVIQEEKSPDIELLHELNGDELKEAKEKYGKFADGTLYNKQNKRVREAVEVLRDLEDAQ